MNTTTARCKVCKRVLKNPKHAAAGIGPVCKKKYGNFTVHIKKQSANYEIVEDGSEVLLIRDLGPWDVFKTITNAAEQVVSELAERLNGRRLEYIDSEGRRDRLLVTDGKFSGFAPVGEAA